MLRQVDPEGNTGRALDLEIGSVSVRALARKVAFVAMVGCRMAIPGYRDVIVVCTHPSFRGRGSAGASVCAVMVRSPNMQRFRTSTFGKTVWAGANENIGGVRAKFADTLRPGPNQRFSKEPNLPGRIGAMYQDRSGALWFAVDTGPVVYKHGKAEKVLTHDGQFWHAAR